MDVWQEGVGTEESEANNGASNGHKLATLASFAGLCIAAASLGSLANRRGLAVWYKALRKPPFQPSPKVFAPVWTVLYGLIAVSGYRVWRRQPSPERSRALALWGTQIGLNAAWSPLFFGARKPGVALVDLVALFAAVTAYIDTTRRIDKPAAAMVAPYLAWLGFAGVLNEEIVRRNRRTLPRFVAF